jgi:uncharacterized protein YceH (UPF0502 family)
MGWRCITCSEVHEDAFDTCWNCGTGREGGKRPDFVRATDPPEQERFVDAIADHAGVLAADVARTLESPSRRRERAWARALNERFEALEAEVATLRAELDALRRQVTR